MEKNASAKRPTVAEPLLPKAWEVPQEFRDRLGDDVGRQRVMRAEGHMLLVLHAPPGRREHVRRGRLYWRNAEGDWRPLALKHGDHPVGELLAEYEAVLQSIEENELEAEDAREYFEVLTSLGPMIRSCRNLYDVLSEARKAETSDRGLILLRDRAYAITRRADLLQQDAKNTLDFVIARQAERQAQAARRQAKASHRLNILVAIFFPIATLAGILGMNLGHGLEKADASYAPLPMMLVLGAGLVLGTVIAWFITRK